MRNIDIVLHMSRHNKSKSLGCTCPILVKQERIMKDLMKMDVYLDYKSEHPDKIEYEKYLLIGSIYGRKIFRKIK